MSTIGTWKPAQDVQAEAIDAGFAFVEVCGGGIVDLREPEAFVEDRPEWLFAIVCRPNRAGALGPYIIEKPGQSMIGGMFGAWPLIRPAAYWTGGGAAALLVVCARCAADPEIGFERNPGPEDLNDWTPTTAEDAPPAVRGVACDACGAVPIPEAAEAMEERA